MDNVEGGTCSCRSGYVPQTSPITCVACHASCSVCVDSSSSGCTECKITEAKLSNAAGGSCSCPSNYVPQSPALTSCVSCHASCQTCTNNSASGCLTCKVPEATLDNPLGGTCACTAPLYKDKLSPTTPCEPLCDPSCSTCTNPTSAGCLTCKVAEASLTKADGGMCYCGIGYVREFSPTTSCGTCAPNDCVCSGLKGTPCLQPELRDFVLFARTVYSLPLASPVNGAWCFASPKPASKRATSEVEAAIGPITRDGNGNVQPTQEECIELLRVQWPFVDYWFKLLFPGYSPPAEATEEDKYAMEMGLRIWILRFGGSIMFTNTDWSMIVAAFNAPATEWSNYLAWTDGYSTNAELPRIYPTALLASLSDRDLWMFNHFSTVCGSAGCKLKTQCQQSEAASVCATS